MTDEEQYATKKQILNGKADLHDVNLPDGRTVRVRPLADGEWAEVEACQVRGQTVTAEADASGEAGKPKSVTIDMEQMQRADYESDVLAAAHGLTHSGEIWTPNDVRRIPIVGAARTIAKKIYAITGVTKDAEELVRSFRDDADGAGDRDAAHDREPPGADRG